MQLTGNQARNKSEMPASVFRSYSSNESCITLDWCKSVSDIIITSDRFRGVKFTLDMPLFSCRMHPSVDIFLYILPLSYLIVDDVTFPAGSSSY